MRCIANGRRCAVSVRDAARYAHATSRADDPNDSDSRHMPFANARRNSLTFRAMLRNYTSISPIDPNVLAPIEARHASVIANELNQGPDRRARADRRLHSRRRMDALNANDQAFRALVQHSQDIITLHDENGVTLYESPSAARVLGYPPGALIGRVPFESIHPKDLKRTRAAFQLLLEGEDATQPIEFRFRHARGHWINLEALGSNLLRHSSIQGVVLTSRDVTERKEAEARATYLTHHDALTGLPNRLLMQDRLNQAITQARRNGGQVALMFIDLDRFKLVNDSFGNMNGEPLLKQAAAGLRHR